MKRAEMGPGIKRVKGKKEDKMPCDFETWFIQHKANYVLLTPFWQSSIIVVLSANRYDDLLALHEAVTARGRGSRKTKTSLLLNAPDVAFIAGDDKFHYLN